jgi:ParB-like chromosome segregation protein Spo0J
MQKDGSEIFTLPPEQILEDRSFNIRIFYGDIDQLAIRLMTEGQLEPIKVRLQDGQYFVVDGHRRQLAFARARGLSIVEAAGRHVVLEGDRQLREAPGPLHRDYDPERIQCRLIEDPGPESEILASQLVHNSGTPFTLLERMIFLSRLGRLGSFTREQLALKTGFAPALVSNAQNLNGADPRLLDFVREGRVSQKLALRLLRAFPAEQQMARVCAAMDEAGRDHRDRLLPRDFDWGRGRAASPPEPRSARTVDPVRARLRDVASRLGDALRFAPNHAAQDRLATLMAIYSYATGKLSYARLEAHLLGRE